VVPFVFFLCGIILSSFLPEYNLWSCITSGLLTVMLRSFARSHLYVYNLPILLGSVQTTAVYYEVERHLKNNAPDVRLN
jgi:hypothetical protein